jgi:hypothetical protein
MGTFDRKPTVHYLGDTHISSSGTFCGQASRISSVTREKPLITCYNCRRLLEMNSPVVERRAAQQEQAAP